MIYKHKSIELNSSKFVNNSINSNISHLFTQMIKQFYFKQFNLA